jgi:hypothetical protein
MSQITGNPGLGYSGLHMGAGATGPMAHFFGVGDPNLILDTSADRVTVVNACPGSLYSRTDTGQLYVKQTSGAWVAVTVP